MKVYLSGPMTGIPSFNVPAFEKATAKLRVEGHRVVSPHELDSDSGIGEHILNNATGDVSKLTAATGETWGTLLARDVKILADRGIEAIFVLPRWWESKGARLEVYLGLLHGIEIWSYLTGNRIPHEDVIDALTRQLKEKKHAV